MSGTIAIDPGPVESAYVMIDSGRKPVEFGKIANAELLALLRELKEPVGFRRTITRAAIEMVASYGMPVGAEVFETCVWAGRFYETLDEWVIPASWSVRPLLIKRLAVKLHLCHDSRAKDSNVRQALVDQFAKGESNFGKGTKANPGWFYGFSNDVWQAYALAVYAADTDGFTAAGAA
jgi:hypothetical protein